MLHEAESIMEKTLSRTGNAQTAEKWEVKKHIRRYEYAEAVAWIMESRETIPSTVVEFTASSSLIGKSSLWFEWLR